MLLILKIKIKIKIIINTLSTIIDNFDRYFFICTEIRSTGPLLPYTTLIL